MTKGRGPARAVLAGRGAAHGEEALDDELPDRAAALTYYGVLSVFPALLLMVASLGVAGESVTRSLLDGLGQLAPGPARDLLSGAVRQLRGPARRAG